MKKNLLIVLTGILAVLLVFMVTNSDSYKFKLEYESLNGQKNESGKKYMNVKLKNTDVIEYADYDKVFDILDGTGVIYFGFPECPWCRNAVSVLLETAKEANVKVYYMNNLDDRNTSELKDNKVVTTKKGTKNYNKLLKKLGDSADVYDGLNDESIKRLYFPTVIVVKNGKIVDYISGTVDSQEDPYKALNNKQKKELKTKYKKAFSKMSSCDKEEKC